MLIREQSWNGILLQMLILMILQILYTLLTKQVTLRKQNILENTKPNLKMMEKISSTFLTCTLLKKHIIIFCIELHTCQTNYIFIAFSYNFECKKSSFLQMHCNSSWSRRKNNLVYENRDDQTSCWKTNYTSSCLFNAENWNHLCGSFSHNIPNSLLRILFVCDLQKTKTTEEIKVISFNTAIFS